MDDLKPCPFCPDGGEPELQEPIDYDDLRGCVMCMKCYATVEADHWQKAIEIWNTRTHPPGYALVRLDGAEERVARAIAEEVFEDPEWRIWLPESHAAIKALTEGE